MWRKKKEPPDAEGISDFNYIAHRVVLLYEDGRMYNMDEISWGQLHLPLTRITQRGKQATKKESDVAAEQNKRTVVLAVNDKLHMCMPLIIEERKGKGYYFLTTPVTDNEAVDLYNDIKRIESLPENKKGGGDKHYGIKHAHGEDDFLDVAQDDKNVEEPGGDKAMEEKCLSIRRKAAKIVDNLLGGKYKGDTFRLQVYNLFNHAVDNTRLYFPCKKWLVITAGTPTPLSHSS